MHTSLASRNSAVELLRLIAMLMIVGYHWVYVSDATWIGNQSLGFTKFFYQVIIAGGVGRKFHLLCHFDVVSSRSGS